MNAPVPNLQGAGQPANATGYTTVNGNITGIGYATMNGYAFSPRYIVLPHEWVDYYRRCSRWPRPFRKFVWKFLRFLMKTWPFSHLDLFRGGWNTTFLADEPVTKAICRFYAESRPKSEWPLLIGVNDVMDKALGHLLKEKPPSKLAWNPKIFGLIRKNFKIDWNAFAPEPMVDVPRECVEYWAYRWWPRPIRDFFYKHGISTGNSSTSYSFVPKCSESVAKKMCHFFIKSKPKKEWPLLIGTNPIMNEVLGEALKKGDFYEA